MKLPDLAELIAARATAHGLTLHARRPAVAALQGGHRSAQRGRGLEFEEVRLYVAGDDARAIDWRVTARRGRPHTKLFREERERAVWLVADLHPGLFFGSKLQYKSALLVRAAAILGWAAALGGDRLGAVVGSAAQPLLLPPRARQAGVLPVLQALAQAQPQAPGVPSDDGLARTLLSLRPLLQPGSLVLVLSDFHSLDARAEALLAAVALHNDVRLLAVSDPLERAGLPDGAYRVGLPGRSWWLDGKRSRTPWQAAWQDRAARVTALARRLALPLTQLDTAQPIADVLPALLKEPRWAA